MENSMGVPQKTKIDLPYDPAIPLLGILLKESKSAYNRNSCAPMFIMAVFTRAKLWNQLRCPSVDECIYTKWSIIQP
jgi:hypothetical protein